MLITFACCTNPWINDVRGKRCMIQAFLNIVQIFWTLYKSAVYEAMLYETWFESFIQSWQNCMRCVVFPQVCGHLFPPHWTTFRDSWILFLLKRQSFFCCRRRLMVNSKPGWKIVFIVLSFLSYYRFLIVILVFYCIWNNNDSRP